MNTTDIAGKDFADWVELAENDPAAFEKLRLAAIESYIESVPHEHQQRLRRLQWRIDQERRLARTPMAACLRLSRMMWDSLLGQGGLRERLEGLGGLLQGAQTQERPRAVVLPLARGDRQREASC